MKKIIRIYNIELRKYDTDRYEIVQYYPNEYYGKESDYIFDGKETYKDPNREFVSINASCFKSPESCMTITSFDINYNEPDCWLRFCGDRPLKLWTNQNKKPFDAFMSVVMFGYDTIHKMLKISDEDE